MHKPPVIILSSPSGCGKNTVLNHVKWLNLAPIDIIVSSTTREKRVNNSIPEENGKEYYFLSQDEFRESIASGDMLEYVEYAGNHYGSTRSELDRIQSLGKTPIYNVEVRGAATFKKLLADEYHVITIFLLPPSLEILEARLRGRGSDTEEKIQKRLETAKTELTFQSDYDYHVINDDIDRAAWEITNIILSVL